MPAGAREESRNTFTAPSWGLGRLVLRPRGRPLVMGILNLTPDSFHGPSRNLTVEKALGAAQTMITAGVDILDLGAESSRPGAALISAAEEQDRLLPVLEALRAASTVPVSVDTIRASTARFALQSGADAVNDISACRHDPDMLALIAEAGCGVVLMHMQGNPRTMQDNPCYEDVVASVKAHLEERFAAAQDAGIKPDRIAVDPGIGFGKTLVHNLALLGGLREIAAGRPLLLGASRKSFIGEITGAAVDQRLPGSLAALAMAFLAGTSLVRVHDVPASIQFLTVLEAVAGQG